MKRTSINANVFPFYSAFDRISAGYGVDLMGDGTYFDLPYSPQGVSILVVWIPADTEAMTIEYAVMCLRGSIITVVSG